MTKKQYKKYKSTGIILSAASILVLPLGMSSGMAEEVSDGLTVENMSQNTPEDLVNTILGDGVTVQNVQLTGVERSSGTFSGGTGIIGFEDGIVLSTGDIEHIVGPNVSDDISAVNDLPGDPDLEALIPGFNTNDATILEFEFIPENDVVSFQYVFASDEYNEYVNTEFNDVFGFFINGENRALLPDNETVVSINNVNGGNPFGTDASNPEFFRNNDLNDGGGDINTEMDGLTVVLSVEAQVNAGEVNTIKMAIADAGDFILDSNVMIKAGSFTDQPAPPNGPTPPEDEYTPIGFNKMTGGGQVASEENAPRSTNHNFGFNIQEKENGAEVNLQFNANKKGASAKKNKNAQDADSPLQIKAKGTASNVQAVEDENGQMIGIEFEIPVMVRTLHDGSDRIINQGFIRIVDRGEPNTADEFYLEITDGPSKGFTSGLPLTVNGNIKLHK